MDESNMKNMKTDLEMIGGLAEEYYALFYYNIRENRFNTYTLDREKFPMFEEMLKSALQADGLSKLLKTYEPVHPADKSLFDNLNLDTIRKELAESKKYSVCYRRKFDGEYRWVEIDIIKYESICEPANAIAIGFAERDVAIRSRQTLKSVYEILGKKNTPQTAIDELLSIAGEFYGAERCYIFENKNNDELIDNTYEWCAEGVEAEIDKLQNIPTEFCKDWYAEFHRQGAFFMDSRDSEHNTPEGIELLEMQGIQSLVAAPIISDNKTVGFIGVDNPKKAQTDINVLQTIAVVTYSEILKRNELRRTAERVRELINQQRHLKAFGNMINAGLWSMIIGRDNKPKEIAWSDEFRHMFGYEASEEDFPNTLEAWSDLLHPDEKQAVLDDFWRGLECTDTDGYVYDIEYRILRKSGEYCWYHAIARMEDAGNSDRRIFGIIVDISADKELAEALTMAQSASRAKTTFLNNMSHDIRTPMNAIIGYTGLAASHIDNKNQVQDYLEKIAQSSNHLLSLINDILDMSRIESGKMNLDEKPENLQEIIQTLQDIVQADIHAKHHEFFIDTVNVNDENILCDKLRLNQVLLNILSNSIKYTPAGGTISMRITEKDVKSNGYASFEFKIKDNGIGMDKEFVKTIYDPFTREKSSTVSGIQGTGLGMAITKNIIDMMGGEIDISTQLHKGTETTLTFDFRLTETPVEAKKMESRKYSFEGKKILIVEDNEMNREIATEILSAEGFIIDSADDGTVAVEMMRDAESDKYDLVLMDIQMPIMDGYEATRQIRGMNSHIAKNIPIIAMTANAFEEDRQAAITAGMNEHIAKPINVDELKSVLAKLL